MKEMKRTLALVLCLVMLVGMMPAFAFTAEAAEETIYVLAGGDFQAGDGGQEDHYYSRINMGNILDKIKRTHDTMDGFIFVGDYDGDTHNDSNANTGVAAMMEEVSARFTTLNHDNSYLIEGNHETGAVSGIDATGGYDCNGYAVYLINETDFCERQEGKSAQIQTVANNLKTWLNNKIGEGYDAPIFVATHTPLGYTTRTYTNGDSLYGKYVFDVLNDAAANGLNIIFLHGHDHAYGADNYLGGEAIYLPVGDKINICVPGDKTAWTEETLNFTYMNAGYVGYYNENYYDVTSYEAEKLTMTVFAITGNQVTVERWSKNGLYNLKSAGREGFYSNASTCANIGLSYNTTVYASPQTIVLGEAEDYGDIGSWVGIATETPADDVITSNEGWVELIAPVPGTPATEASTTYKYVLDTDGVNTNTKYLIVNTSSDGTAYILTNNNGSVTATRVEVSDGEISISDETNVNWMFSGSSSGTVVNQGRYIYPENGSISLNTSGSNMTISNEGNGEYQIYRRQNANYGYYYWIEYDNGWTGARNYSSGSRGSVYLFAYDSTITTPATEATPDTNGTYGKIVGNLTYNATAGMTADEAMALVKAGVDGYYYNAMSTPGSDVTGTIVDDSVLTWEWVDTFDGNTAGDYEVAIKYGDFLLGTAEVVVPATTTYYIAEGNGLYLVDMNTSADNAMAAVKAGVTVYSATDEGGSNKTAIDDANVTWNWVDTYNGADSGPYTVEILYNGTSLGTVEVKVNVKYTTGITTDWTYIGESEATGGTTTVTYELDTDGLEQGEDHKYVIVAESQDLALYATSTANSTAPSVTISADGKTLTTTTRDYEYYYVSTYGFTKDGSKGLYGQDYYIRYGNRDGAYLDGVINNGNGYYTLWDNEGTYRGLTYTDRFTVAEPYADQNVRLYKFVKEETTGGTPAGSIYALIEGNTVYTVEQGTSATQAMAAVKAGITGYTATDEGGTGKTELADSALTWKWKNTYASMITGSYWVEISYQGKVLGTVEVKVEPGVVNNYPEYPDEGAVKVNKTATGVDFQSSGIAQVEVSASGVPIKKGADVIIMLDTSSSMRYCLDCADGTAHSSYVCDQGGQTRAQALEETLADLIAQFNKPGDDGELLDIRVAIADFNGFNGYGGTSGTPYDRDEADHMNDTAYYTANGNNAKIYTGDATLTAGAFVDAEDLANTTFDLNYDSGTNYDYAFDAIYQMGTAIKEANGSEERDLYVIFMSDGAAMQWNYYHSQGASNLWENWITGKWTVADLTSTNLNCTTHAYYYDEVDHDGDGIINEHRMANAVKGDPSEEYEVIRKTNTLGTPTGETNMYMVPGLGATMFSIAFDPETDTNVEAEHMVSSIATLASDQTGTTKYFYNVASADELSTAFTAIGSEIAYAASNARYVDQMGDDFNLQLKTETYTVVDGDTTTTKTLAPVIEIITYDIYTKAEAEAGDIPEGKNVGDRKGTSTLNEVVKFSEDGTKAYSNLIDVDGDGTYGVTINSDGSYTIADTDDNIIGTDGVIYAKSFVYNTTATGVAVEGLSIPEGIKADGTTTGSTNVLPSETFYWKMGTVTTTELAMRYYVYLEGAMDGTREAGSYPTNEYAILYYDNYLGNPCHKDTVSPVMAWKEANVSYAFYLVDENGNIIVNQTTGQTGTFANKIAVTNPVVYETVLLNSDEEVSSIDIASLGVLPEGYQLYDYDGTNGATYTVTINSNTTGKWAITSVKDVATTYVTQYDPNNAAAYSNEKRVSTNGLDYTHTIVWFAVLWKVQALPDTVVIDYGLPVDISVLTNDMFGENGKLAGVGAYSDSLNLDGYDTTLASGFGSSYTGTYGVATTDTSTGKVRYTLNTSNGMQMQTYEKFAYAVNYTGTTNPGYYYDTVTVIPATTIYYEDNFVTTESYTWDYTTNGWKSSETSVWTQIGEVNGVQDEDRPGQYSLTDANNIYGYDSANLNMSTYSMDNALKAVVNYDNKGHAVFTFWGTGFDIISMTSNTTGTILVDIVKEDGSVYDNFAVDTYYGYKKELYNVTYTYTNGEWVKTVGEVAAEGTAESKVDITTAGNENDVRTGVEYVWVVDANADDSIYQVPVIKVVDMPYGKYTVTIKATYDPGLDHVDPSYDAGSYEFYLDAIRIYDPANDGTADGTGEGEDNTIEDAYEADGEGWPSYFELRNHLIDADTMLGDYSVDSDSDGDVDSSDVKITGAVFIDGDSTVGNDQIADYTGFGPNNEVYLAPGQSIAFILGNVTDNVENIYIGIKLASGETGTYTITNVAQNANTESGIKAGQFYGPKTNTIKTATDMYYDLTGWKGDIIVISNTGDDYNTTGIISLTNIKATYKADPEADVVTGPDSGVSTASVGDLDNGISVASVSKQSSDVSVLSTTAETEETETVETVSNEVYAYMTPAAATLTLRSLNTPVDDESTEETEPTEPEVTEPETTVPEVTEPETTVPEVTEPETTVPEVTEPETTVPEETEPETTVPGETEPESSVEEEIKTIVKEIIDLIGGWFGKWF